MPEIETTIDDTSDLLERVRQQQGLETINQAAEWLLKRSVRSGVKSITGRGRALYAVERKTTA